MKKKKRDQIEVVIQYLLKRLIEQKYEAERKSVHIITWQTSHLPYDELQDILAIVIGETEFMVKDFAFYCRALGGDSIGWELTLHIKDLEPKP